MTQVGRAVAREAKSRDCRILEIRNTHVLRDARAGRQVESLGEDPLLAARMTVAYIHGVQGEGVAAAIADCAGPCPSAATRAQGAPADERALQEIYWPPWRAAVQEAGAWPILRSDSSGDEARVRGTNAQAPTRGESAIGTLDERVRRVLRMILVMGLDRPRSDGVLNTREHQQLARDAALAGIVLLKNEGLLPIDAKKVGSVAVIGPLAEKPRAGCSVGTCVQSFYEISPLAALKEKLGPAVRIRYVPGLDRVDDLAPMPAGLLIPTANGGGQQGLLAEYFAGADLAGEPIAQRIETNIQIAEDVARPARVPAVGYTIRWTGAVRVPIAGRYTLTMACNDGCRATLDGTTLIDAWMTPAETIRRAVVTLPAHTSRTLRIEARATRPRARFRIGLERSGRTPLSEAVAAAKKADIALIFAGDPERDAERDPHSLALSSGQEDLIAAVALANPRTALVLQADTATLLGEGARRVPAILAAWHPGQEGGNAIADILLGEANPAGRLPVSFPARQDDPPAGGAVKETNDLVLNNDGVPVGYPRFEAQAMPVLFPFGHGLSYTSFSYRDISVTPASVPAGQSIEVRLTVQNTGARDGTEVVQLYVRDLKSSLPRPVKELKAWQKVALKAGAEQVVVFTLDPAALSYYDPERHNWIAEPGVFEVQIGASSRDIWLRGRFTLE
jgi:beta-glucosidase